MAWRSFRELLAWVLFATVTAVHLHARTQLELCMTQLATSHTQMRTYVNFPLVETSGPSELSNATLSEEPSRAVGYADPLPDVELAAATSGGTPIARFRAHTAAHPLTCNFGARPLAFR